MNNKVNSMLLETHKENQRSEMEQQKKNETLENQLSKATTKAYNAVWEDILNQYGSDSRINNTSDRYISHISSMNLYKLQTLYENEEIISTYKSLKNLLKYMQYENMTGNNLSVVVINETLYVVYEDQFFNALQSDGFTEVLPSYYGISSRTINAHITNLLSQNKSRKKNKKIK